MNYIYFVFCIVSLVSTNQYYLDQYNKFEDILLFINDNVPEGDGSLINRIKNHVESASKSLWTATSHLGPGKAGVRFGTVHIRVPETWRVAGDQITWQQCNTALFFVTTDKTDIPKTKHLKKCGEPGEFTRFPESFFRATVHNETFKKGKQLMNEFVTVRYGVFTEKPYKNRLKTFNGINYIDSVCGQGIQWNMTMDKTQCVESNKICKYKIIPNQSHNYSVMFDTETETSNYFCDDQYRPHNKFAYNLHNRKCKSRSVTSVILDHQDFKQNKPPIPYENVNFRIIKGQSKRIILVLDTSGSMQQILPNMLIATVEFLKILENSAQIGIVNFDSSAYIQSHLLQIGLSDSRDKLINIIRHLRLGGYTNIPDGLAKAVTLLGGDITNDAKIYGSIILLTDGQSNRNDPYTYEFVIKQIIKKGIVINAIAYGTAADSSLVQLTTKTGGRYLFADPNTQYTDLAAKFSIKASCDISGDREIKIVEYKTEIIFNQKVQTINAPNVDKYIGRDIKFTVTVPLNQINFILTLIDPENLRFSSIQKIQQTSSVTFTFQIPGKPKTGMYKIEFRSPNLFRRKRSTDTFTVSITISAKPEPKSQRIISPTGELSSSQIDLLTDTSTIIANVDLSTCGILESEKDTVSLIMDGPVRRGVVFQMTDDGIGDDAIENDKIFTKVLTARDLQDVGFYNFMANVEIINKKTNESITRTVELGSLRIKDKQQQIIVDKIPPSKIENLQIKNQPNPKSLKISFTAPGNDGMNGNITKYEVLIKSSIKLTVNFTSNVETRKEVNHPLYLKDENITNPFDISVRGIDDNNNFGEWSDPVIYNWDQQKIYKSFIISKKSTAKLMISLDILSILLLSFLFIFYVAK